MVKNNYLSSFEDKYEELNKLLWGDGSYYGLLMNLRWGKFSEEDEKKFRRCAELFRSFNGSLTENQKKMIFNEEVVYQGLVDYSNEGMESAEDQKRLTKVLDELWSNPITPTPKEELTERND